jgi:poly(3-hydroxybutyrate) depolymerase
MKPILTGCVSVALLLVVCDGEAGAEKELGAGTHERALTFGDKARAYQLHIPPAALAKKPVPLVLVLHGTKGDGLSILRRGWTKTADREGFLVVCPDGTGDPRSWPAGWNGPRAPASEVAFLRALLDHLEKEFRVDPKRIYVCGMSAGAHMSHRLGAEFSDRIAAIGPVAGTIGARDGGRDAHTPDPKSPVSVIIIHGKKDSHVPYEGGKNPGGHESEGMVHTTNAARRETRHGFGNCPGHNDPYFRRAEGAVALAVGLSRSRRPIERGPAKCLDADSPSSSLIATTKSSKAVALPLTLQR